MKSHLDELAAKSPFFSMIRFLCRHPPLKGDVFGFIDDDDADEGYSAAIQATFPNADDSFISVGEITRRKVMILGLELVAFERRTMEHCGCVWRTWYPVPLVRLPDGKLFEIHDDDDLAKLRAILGSSSQPAEEPSQPPSEGGQPRPQIVWRNPSDTV